MDFATYFELLTRRFADTRSSADACVVLAFRDQPEEEPRRLTIDLGPSGVSIREGFHADAERPSVCVIGQLADWIAFWELGDSVRLTRLAVYGDTRLFQALARTPCHPAEKSDDLGWSAV